MTVLGKKRNLKAGSVVDKGEDLNLLVQSLELSRKDGSLVVWEDAGVVLCVLCVTVVEEESKTTHSPRVPKTLPESRVIRSVFRCFDFRLLLESNFLSSVRSTDPTGSNSSHTTEGCALFHFPRESFRSLGVLL